MGIPADLVTAWEGVDAKLAALLISFVALTLLEALTRAPIIVLFVWGVVRASRDPAVRAEPLFRVALAALVLFLLVPTPFRNANLTNRVAFVAVMPGPPQGAPPLR